MLKNLKEFSKFLFLIGVILYCFGFITISTFLARFGIITFDILNTRFLIAGLLAIIPFAIALFTALWLLEQIPPKTDPLEVKKFWKIAFFIIFGVPGVIYTVSNVIVSLFKIWDYQSPATLNVFHFTYFLGNYDYIGQEIAKLKLFPTAGMDFVEKYILYFFAYALLIGFIVTLILIVISWRKKKPTENKSEIPNTKKEVVSESAAQINAQKTETGLSIYLKVNVIIFVILEYIALYVFSVFKLKTNFIDLRTLIDSPTLTPSLLFAWIYGISIPIYFYFAFVLKEKIDIKLIPNIFRLENIPKLDDWARYAIIPMVTALVFFGWTIFPRIPFSVGGGQPRQVTVKLKEDLPEQANSKIYLLGDSNEFIFLATVHANSSEAFQVNKDQVLYILTKEISN